MRELSESGIEVTSAISDEELGLLKAMRQRAVEQQGLSLRVYHPDRIQVIDLVDGESVIVGRSEPADVIVRDSSLSRRHAAFELLERELWVEDLGSTNGTWVDGERITRRRLGVGEEVLLGRVVVAVHGVESSCVGLLGHDRFLQELEAEVERARAFGRGLALLMLRGARDGRALSQWLPTLRTALRGFDRVALYSTSTTEILLPEVSEERALEIARALAGSQRPSLSCGVALYPQNGRSPDALIDAARGALADATPEVPLTVATARSVSRVPSGPAPGLVVASPAMREVYATCTRLAGSVIPILLLGETGTGKEVVARAIHESGKRKDRPMICVNCGAIPGQLVESTLFGHEKGAFTGAVQQVRGVFENADGGTVLLDEIGELPLSAQAALLRVLETKRVTRVGGSRELQVDVRVLAATHRDLESMCRREEFREDLLYRLNAVTVRIPALRERREEIEPLARHFVLEANRLNDCQVERLDGEALALMLRYVWPGNVRELRNVIERAVVIAQRTVIAADDLPERLREGAVRPALSLDEGEPTPAGSLGTVREPADDDGAELDLKSVVERAEARAILGMLRHTRWNRKETARRLGISLRTLAYKQQAYGIRRLSYEQVQEAPRP